MGDCCDMEPETAQECVGRCKKMPAPFWWLSCKFSGIKWGIKSFIRRHRKSPMELWAEHEVEVAVAREMEADRKDAEEHGRKYSPKEFSYGGEIYKSALRAFKSLLKDDHSGMSWAFTASALRRLMDNRPLTPLAGSSDEWVECGLCSPGHGQDFQNARCSSVFKNVSDDGNVTYSDINAVIGVNADDPGDTHHMSLCSQAVYELHPIKFPYMPPSKPYKVTDRIFAMNGNPGEFDTVAILSVTTPDGKVEAVNKYYKEDEDGHFVQIGKDEYDLRYESYKSARMNK